MQHIYTVAGMHCQGCIQKVSHALQGIDGAKSVKVTLDPAEAVIEMNRHIPVGELNTTLGRLGSYSLIEKDAEVSMSTPAYSTISDDATSIKAYFPLLLVFGFLTGTVTLHSLITPHLGLSSWMSNFMGGFFLIFSFFKLLDIKGFAASYSSYDIITKRWLAFGYIYPFIELAFGLGFLFFPMYTSLYIATLIVMSVSIVGVIQSVTQKRRIQCACLGTVFKLPMGTITIIEDGLMIAMSIAMLIL